MAPTTLRSQHCVLQCNELHGSLVDDTRITPVACAEGPRMMDCSDWSPARGISFEEQSGVYVVERSLVESLTLDPEPLRACDDAVFMRVTSGGYQVVGASPGELVHELGLRDHDVLLSLNHYPLHTASDVALAFTELWSNGAATFELELRRDGRPTNLRYSLVEP